MERRRQATTDAETVVVEWQCWPWIEAVARRRASRAREGRRWAFKAKFPAIAGKKSRRCPLLQRKNRRCDDDTSISLNTRPHPPIESRFQILAGRDGIEHLANRPRNPLQVIPVVFCRVPLDSAKRDSLANVSRVLLEMKTILPTSSEWDWTPRK